MATPSIFALFDSLRRDRCRETNAFSQDLVDAHAVMHHPFANEDEIAEAVREWCLKRQPCNFGRIAAKHHFIHFCILTERDLRDEGQLKDKVAEEKRIWKRRALQDMSSPPHSFMLVLTSQRVALAAPDDNLMRFASRLRDLAGWNPNIKDLAGNPVTGDYLYLKEPGSRFYYGFQFNVDFFAAAADGRWWHDHRVPGGIAFTANSTGHMQRWQEWYGRPEEPDRTEWFLRNAMMTIAQAHPTAGKARRQVEGASEPAEAKAPTGEVADREGRATWLRDLRSGQPLKNYPCPFRGQVKLPKALEGKDWTVYEGLLHTDHAIRHEFFEDRELPSTRARPYVMDLTYLYARELSDYVKFVGGVRFAEEDVYADLGKKEEWLHREAVAVADRPPEAEADVRRLLEVCRAWPPSPDLQGEPSL